MRTRDNLYTYRQTDSVSCNRSHRAWQIKPASDTRPEKLFVMGDRHIVNLNLSIPPDAALHSRIKIELAWKVSIVYDQLTKMLFVRFM